jgi:hypothetical protein
LLVDVGGADMPLYDDVLAPVAQSLCDNFADFLPGHEDIKYIDARIQRRVNGSLYLLIGFTAVQMLAAKAYNARFQTGVAQCPVFHT